MQPTKTQAGILFLFPLNVVVFISGLQFIARLTGLQRFKITLL